MHIPDPVLFSRIIRYEEATSSNLTYKTVSYILIGNNNIHYTIQVTRKYLFTIVKRRVLTPGLMTSISVNASTRKAQSPFTICTIDASMAS